MSRARSYHIVVPTRNSERWISAFYHAYQRLGIDPIYLFDTRSDDCTGELLNSLGAVVVPVRPKHDRVEAMLEMTHNIASDAWIIRFDDDEMPSSSLISWLDQNISGIKEHALAISRRDVLLRDNCLCYSRMELYYFHPLFLTYLNPQWRGFIPNHVKFTNAIHTPGFEFSSFATIPESAYFVHFDWMLRSQDERIGKLRRYEQQSPGSGWRFAQYYLPELIESGSARWTPIDSDEFAPLLTELKV